MATAQNLLTKLNKQLKIIEEAKQEIDSIALDVERLQQPDVLKVGDRVRLRADWSTKNVGSGWRGYQHFMVIGNTATIIQVEVYQQKISYFIRFDNQECFYTFTRSKSESLGYISDGCFFFKPNDLVKLDEPPRFYRKHERNDEGLEFSIVHKRLNFETTAYQDKEYIYVCSKDPVSFYSGSRQYLYQPYTKEEFNATWSATKNSF